MYQWVCVCACAYLHHGFCMLAQSDDNFSAGDGEDGVDEYSYEMSDSDSDSADDSAVV